MLEVLLDALLDSFKVFVFVLVFYIVFSFAETKISLLLQKNKKLSPSIGSIFGLIPQCGISILASDLYLKRHITMGTIVSIFIACSDEALPILFTRNDKILESICIIVTKIILGFVVGFVVDYIYTKNKNNVEEHHKCCTHEIEIHKGCCNHEIDNEHNESIEHHLVHPIVHSIKIFIYVFIINMIFGSLFYYIGEEAINEFLIQNKYLSPLFTTLIGLIPNCASSVIISNLYIIDMIPLGACLSGLIVNAGLGTIYLFKSKDHFKEGIIILMILILVSLLAGYIGVFICA